jgi:hypothetical protein
VGDQGEETARAGWKRVFEWVVDLWIAGVLVTFFVLRVLDSNTGRQLLKLLRTR